MNIVIKENYWIVPASVLNSTTLSFKAKGLYAYIQAKPDGWDFSILRMQDETKESRESITSGIKELQDVWLLKREKQATWRTVYILSTLLCPVSEKPKVGKTQVGENPTWENPTHNNTINKENYNIKKTIGDNKWQQLDIMSEEIYQAYMLEMPQDKKKYAKKAQSMLYISYLLKTYDSMFLLSCIATYKKNVEKKWWKAPQYFFSNTKNVNAKEYMFFLDYAPTSETISKPKKTQEDIEKAMLFFNS